MLRTIIVICVLLTGIAGGVALSLYETAMTPQPTSTPAVEAHALKQPDVPKNQEAPLRFAQLPDYVPGEDDAQFATIWGSDDYFVAAFVGAFEQTSRSKLTPGGKALLTTEIMPKFKQRMYQDWLRLSRSDATPQVADELVSMMSAFASEHKVDIAQMLIPHMN